VWHEKESSLLKAINAKHRSKFVVLSLVMVTATGQLKNCSGEYKQTNKYNFIMEGLNVQHFNILSCVNELCISHLSQEAQTQQWSDCQSIHPISSKMLNPAYIKIVS
jgi:hypothetical protein